MQIPNVLESFFSSDSAWPPSAREIAAANRTTFYRKQAGRQFDRRPVHGPRNFVQLWGARCTKKTGISAAITPRIIFGDAEATTRRRSSSTFDFALPISPPGVLSSFRVTKNEQKAYRVTPDGSWRFEIRRLYRPHQTPRRNIVTVIELTTIIVCTHVYYHPHDKYHFFFFHI